MSLIQEALRRQQEDAERTAVPPTPNEQEPTEQGGGPVMPPEPPVPGGAGLAEQPSDGEPSEKRAVLSLLSILLLLAVLVGALGWIAIYIVKQFTNTPAPVKAAVQVEQPDEQPAVATGEVAVAVTNPAVPEGHASGKPGVQTSAPPAAAVETPPVAVPPIKTPPVKAPPSTNTTPPEPPKPGNELAPIQWPSLTVEGKVGAGKAGAAMINGSMVRVGEKIQGVIVLGVGKDGVVLEYKGRQRTLRAGGSTD